MADKPVKDTASDVSKRMPPSVDDGMPGGRAALPEGALPATYLGPQGDEQRDPPPSGPLPVPPAPVVSSEVVPPVSDPPPEMQPVAWARDLADGAMLRAKLGDTDIILVRAGEIVRAFGASCPHAGAPLDAGALCGDRLICPWHKAEFRLHDGAVLEPPALDGLTRYAARVDGDAVLVAPAPLPSPRPARRSNDQTFAIAGSGAAGTAAAVALRRLGFAGRIVLIGPESEAPYDRTALSKFVLSGDMPPDGVPPLRGADWFARNDIERNHAVVSGVDAAARRLQLGDGTTLGYDRALLALGANAKRPEIPGIGLPGVHTLRGAADAAAIVAAATPHVRVVIMGSSFIGLEAASALRKRGVSVTVVAPDSVPFAKQFGPRIGRMFQRLHAANGVAFRLDSGVEAIEGAHAAEAVRLKGGESLPADLVLVGVGVQPATRSVSGLTTDADGAVAVDAAFRVTDGLYAAGDCASFPLHGRQVRIEHWRLAQQHATLAAAAMLGLPSGYDGVPFFWTYHYGKRFEYLGHATDWDDLHIEGDPDQQDFIALQIGGGHVLGAVACQRERATARLIHRMRRPLPAAEAIALIRSAADPAP